MVALAASAMCQRIDRLSILESLDVQGYANEQMFRAMGFDLESDDPGVAQRCEAACGSFKDQIGVLQRTSTGWASGSRWQRRTTTPTSAS